MTCSFDDLRGGLTIDDAIEAILDGCNRGRDRLWITEAWMRPRLQRLRECVRSAVTEEQAEKLRDAVLKREPLDYVVEWICDHREMTWAEFNRQSQEGEVDRVWKAVRASFIDAPILKPDREAPDYGYATVEGALAELHSDPSGASSHYTEAHPCPACGKSTDQLVWTRMFVSHGGKMCGRGWTATVTVCPTCGVPVQRFTPVWGTEAPRRHPVPFVLVQRPPTREERLQTLDSQKVQAAVQFLRDQFPAETHQYVRRLMNADPLHWFVPHHLSFGMTIRNLLRSGGFGEKFFEIDNLDDYWPDFVELAVADAG